MNPALGNLIRRLREQAELSQEELAARAAVSRATIQSVENGRHEPRRASLKRIASALGVEVRDLTSAGAAPSGELAEEEELRAAIAVLERDRDTLRTDFPVTYKAIAKALDGEIEEARLRLAAIEGPAGDEETRESGS